MNLTKTERAILSRLQAGEYIKQIAYDMGIAQSTIRAHIFHITQKHNVNSRFDLPGCAKPKLTHWRQQIVNLYVSGLAFSVIADQLNTDEKTIKTELWEIRREGIEIPYRRERRKRCAQ